MAMLCTGGKHFFTEDQEKIYKAYCRSVKRAYDNMQTGEDQHIYFLSSPKALSLYADHMVNIDWMGPADTKHFKCKVLYSVYGWRKDKFAFELSGYDQGKLVARGTINYRDDRGEGHVHPEDLSIFLGDQYDPGFWEQSDLERHVEELEEQSGLLFGRYKIDIPTFLEAHGYKPIDERPLITRYGAP